jgi:hypothetical protein
MDFLVAGNKFSLLARVYYPPLMSSALLVENVPGKSKSILLRLEFVFGFTPERCSESARNAVRFQPEWVFGLPRNYAS